MSDQVAVLNQAFVRVFRSFGQYLRGASPVWDVGLSELPPLLQREADDAWRLGEYLAVEQGYVETGVFPIEYGDLHYLNISFVLHDWIDHQERLVADLQSDRSQLETSSREAALLDAAIAHEVELLDQLKSLSAVPV